MARRFTPVADPEKARCEQDEESLRKHRKFDTPFALLPSNLNEKRQRGQEDLNPLGRPSGELEQDEKGLWRKKAELFDKQKTWGRETMEYSNPEQARSEGNNGPKWGRPGTVGWGTQGNFGGRGADVGLSVLQRGEVNQGMVKNEKGLWVRKKAPDKSSDDPRPAKKGYWRCSKCDLESAVSLEFCRKFECDGRRPAGVMTDPNSLKASNPSEDPRLEAAKKKSRGTQDAAQQALKALQERRNQEVREKERAGMMRRPVGGEDRRPAPQSSSSGGKQVKPAPRVKQCHRWQGVQRTDEEAKRVVGKAVGGNVEMSGAPLRIEDSEKSSIRQAPSSESKRDRGGSSFADELAAEIEARQASRSRSRSRSPGGDVVVDFF